MLDELPKHQRQVLILRDSYGFEIAELAGAVNRSEDLVEADILAARETLRRELLDTST